MPDVFLYGGEPAPNDVRLRDPTVPGSTPVAALPSFHANLDTAARVAKLIGFRPSSLVAFVYGADVFPTPDVWVPATQTPAIRPATAPRSTVVFTYGDVAPAAPAWVPATQQTPRATPAPRTATPAFPFTPPAWVPPQSSAPTAQRPNLPTSRTFLVGADTPTIAADLPPYMVAGDVAARIAGFRTRNPQSQWFLVTPPDEAPTPPAPSGKKFGGIRILFDEPIRDDDEALALILTLT